MTSENKFGLLRKMLRAIGLSQQESNEELDFIINYDIKYRMGDDPGGDEGEE